MGVSDFEMPEQSGISSGSLQFPSITAQTRALWHPGGSAKGINRRITGWEGAGVGAFVPQHLWWGCRVPQFKVTVVPLLTALSRGSRNYSLP